MKYICKDCGISGVRLFRQYNTIVEALKLKCTACALKDQKMDKQESPSSIGWLVAAIPDDNGSFWGHTSVPQSLVDWWLNLPIYSSEIK